MCMCMHTHVFCTIEQFDLHSISVIIWSVHVPVPDVIVAELRTYVSDESERISSGWTF